MIKTITLMLTACLLVATTQTAVATHHAASSKASEADVKAIDALYTGWREAVEASDIPSYVEVLHKDVRLMPPGAPVIEGAQNYAEFLIPVFETATYRFQVDAMPAITVLGDTAVAEYTYTVLLTLKNPDQAISQPGALTASKTTSRYFDVLRRTDAGWRVWRHTWHTLPE